MDVFIKDSRGKIFEGKVWNKKSTVWPDFSHPNISHYWMYQMELFRKQVPFDGAWIVSGHNNYCLELRIINIFL